MKNFWINQLIGLYNLVGVLILFAGAVGIVVCFSIPQFNQYGVWVGVGIGFGSFLTSLPFFANAQLLRLFTYMEIHLHNISTYTKAAAPPQVETPAKA